MTKEGGEIFMAVTNFNKLIQHKGHKIVIVTYEHIENGGKNIANVAIECETCKEVLIDYDE